MKLKLLKFAPHSIRSKLILWTVIMIVSIIFILLVNNKIFYSIFKHQLEISNQQIIAPYTKEIEMSLQSIKLYVANRALSPQLFQEFILSNETEDELESMQLMQEINQAFYKDLAVYPQMDSIFIYYNNEIIFINNSYQDYPSQNNVSISMKNYLMSHSTIQDWYMQGFIALTVDDQDYLFIADQYNDLIFGCWINITEMFKEYDNTKIEGLNSIMLKTESGQLLGGQPNNNDTNNFLTVTQPFSDNKFNLIAIIDKDEVFKPLYSIWIVFFTFLLILVLCLLSWIHYLRKKIIKPLRNLVYAIDHVREGKSEVVNIEESHDLEIQKVFDALNALICETKELKIEVYETKLLEKETELELFQLQIKPHFFLNSLNNILNFSRLENYEMVRKMTICLSKHFKYILHKKSIITIGEEVSHTENYLEIQSIRHDKKYSYSIDLDEELADECIPILSVQTFVENSLVHSEKHDVNIKITIKKIYINAKNYIVLEIDDTGHGFDENTLAMLNSGQQKKNTQRTSIGIYNIQQRLIMLYGNQSSLIFSNNKTGGAHVEMVIPFSQIKDDIL